MNRKLLIIVTVIFSILSPLSGCIVRQTETTIENTSTTSFTPEPTNTSAPTPSPTLSPEMERQLYIDELYNMSQKDLLLEWCDISKDAISAALVIYGVKNEIYTLNEYIENCRYYLEWDEVEITLYKDSYEVIGILDMDVDVRTALFMDNEEVAIFMHLYRDCLAFDNPNEELVYKYSMISSGVTVPWSNKRYWEPMLEKYSGNRRYLTSGFYDRVFIEINSDNIQLDPEAVVFAKDYFEKIDSLLLNNEISYETKINYIYSEFYLDTELTVFEKLNLIAIAKAYFIIAEENNSFSEIVVNGKTMDEWVIEIQVNSLAELDSVIEDSNQIIELFRTH